VIVLTLIQPKVCNIYTWASRYIQCSCNSKSVAFPSPSGVEQ